jgi:sterol desaturase/sphingolipid hydroxylase (fatty acid hydroxylase superfamily)
MPVNIFEREKVHMTGLDNWASTYGEAAQFIAFFGMIAAMGVAELLVPRARRTQDRKHRWPANVVLTALTILTAPLVPLGIIGVAIYAHQIDFGLIPYLGVSAWVALILGLLLRSLVSYVTHLLMHKVPWFWRIHRVHHLDTHLDISTTVRFHPFETFVTAPITLGAVFLFGIPPTAAILYEALDAGLNVITHANVRIPKRVDRLLGLVFMTPDLHRVHHSPLQAETDSNYCATLSIWDRLFGTLVRRDRDYLASSPIGLDECQDTRANSLIWLLVSPFRSLRRSD